MATARCILDELDESTVWEIVRAADYGSVLSFAAAYDRVGRTFGRVDPEGLPILRSPFGAFDADAELKRACRHGSKLLARFLVDHGADGFYLGLYGACRGGHLGIAKIMARLGGVVDFDAAANFAARSGCPDLLEFTLANGASNWNQILIGAIAGGNLEIAECAVRNGADDWGTAMSAACNHGHPAMVYFCEIHGGRVDANCCPRSHVRGSREFIKHLMSKCSDVNPDWCLELACRGGNLPAIEMARARDKVNFVYGFLGALSGKHPELCARFEWRPTTEAGHRICVRCACRGNNLHLVRESLEKISDLSEALEYAIEGYSNALTIAELLSRGAQFNERCFHAACVRGNLRLVKSAYRALCEQSATTVSTNAGLILACANGNYDAAKFMVELSASRVDHSDSLDKCLCEVSKWSSAAVTRLLLRNGATKIDDAITTAKKVGADNVLRVLEDARSELDSARHELGPSVRVVRGVV